MIPESQRMGRLQAGAPTCSSFSASTMHVHTHARGLLGVVDAVVCLRCAIGRDGTEQAQCQRRVLAVHLWYHNMWQTVPVVRS